MHGNGRAAGRSAPGIISWWRALSAWVLAAVARPGGSFQLKGTPVHEPHQPDDHALRAHNGTAAGSNVAFAVFITKVPDPAFREALLVLAHSFQKLAARSRHRLALLALSPLSLTQEEEAFLRRAGFSRVLRFPLPVDPGSVAGSQAREELRKKQTGGMPFQMAEETIKYWGLTLHEYDRVLVLDADVLPLDPMDELMDLHEDLAGVYDFGLEARNSTLPPVQGGLLLFRPNWTDFREIGRLTERGVWGSDGWEHSGVGYSYGGVGPVGLLSYYYNRGGLNGYRKLRARRKRLPEGLSKRKLPRARWRALDRKVYNVVLNSRLLDDFAREIGARNATEQSLLAAVKSIHFTGDCPKPWACQASPWVPFCAQLADRWWAARAEALEASPAAKELLGGISMQSREERCPSAG